MKSLITSLAIIIFTSILFSGVWGLYSSFKSNMDGVYQNIIANQTNGPNQSN